MKILSDRVAATMATRVLALLGRGATHRFHFGVEIENGAQWSAQSLQATGSLIPVDIVTDFAKALPNARLNILEGDTHLLAFRNLERMVANMHVLERNIGWLLARH